MFTASALLLAWMPSSKAGVIATNLYFFDGTAGLGPQCTLVVGTNGLFYGTTPDGGAGGLGTVFSMTRYGAVSNIVNFFGTNGANPFAGLTLGSDGDMYGVTTRGGVSNAGTIFRMTPAGAISMVISLSVSNGLFPSAGLIQAMDGNFYGTTEGGGVSGLGTLFKMTREGNLTTLYSFSTNAGFDPQAPLLQVADGSFYGSTAGGGPSNTGSIFRMGTNGSVAFLAYLPWPHDNPVGNLLEGPDGALYGVTAGARSGGDGMAFRMDRNGVLTTLAVFDGVGTNGLSPVAGLTLATDGNLYGTCALGGSSNCGIVYRIDSGGSCTTVYTFTGANDGRLPTCALVQAGDGDLYGTTTEGGSNYYGSTFRLSVPMPPLVHLPQMQNGRVALNWTAIAGQRYQLEFSSDLSPNSWSAIGSSVVATNGMVFMNDSGHSTPTGFYRVALFQ